MVSIAKKFETYYYNHKVGPKKKVVGIVYGFARENFFPLREQLYCVLECGHALKNGRGRTNSEVPENKSCPACLAPRLGLNPHASETQDWTKTINLHEAKMGLLEGKRRIAILRCLDAGVPVPPKLTRRICKFATVEQEEDLGLLKRFLLTLRQQRVEKRALYEAAKAAKKQP
jgi:hypothetical protein